MGRRLRPSPALVVAMIALFVSIGGVGYAASKIDTNDIKREAVTKPKIAKKAVSANRIAENAVKTKKIRDQAVTTDKIADQAVNTDKIGDLAVTTPKILDQAVTTEKLADESVTQGKIGSAAVHADELGGTQLAVSPNVNVAANGNGVAAVACPAGTQVLSGGGTTSSFGVRMVTSFQSGNGWIVAYRNDTGAQQTITAIATCLSA
jgi:hypothetical protein